MDGVVSHTRAVQALQITARDAEETHYLRASRTQGFAYVNSGGVDLLTNFGIYLNEKVGAMSQTAELRSQALEEKLYPRHPGPRRREESFQRYGGIRYNIRLSNWTGSAKHTRQVASDIRRRFYSTFRKSIGEETWSSSAAAIDSGNTAAHERYRGRCDLMT